MTAAEHSDQPDVADLAQARGIDVPTLLERVEAGVLGGRRIYTAGQVAARAGVSRDDARSLWRALGFAVGPEDEPLYTDGDVEALRLVQELTDCGFEDEQLRSAMARLFGQTFSRLASWQGQLLLETMAERPELLASEDAVVDLIEHITPVMEQLQNYSWRRQLVAYFSRVAARASQDFATPLSSPVAIGFADMAGFTSLTRRLAEAQLRELLETFESLSTDVVGAHGGRIVKTIGDEVLFQVDGAAQAAEIALEIVEAADADDRMPPLRAGLAVGPVVSRLGDVYGSTVNIASRLTSLCRPGAVLVDRGMSEALRADPRFVLKPMRSESVRGYDHLHPWRLRRADATARR